MVRNIGGFLSFCLRTKPHESMVAAANIFVGSTVAIMLVRDQVHHISLSQLFCMLVAGMSSMSGSVMMVYRMFGIPIVNLLLANLLSAPAALVSAKINVPEKEEDTDTKKGDGFEISKENKANNVLEAMSRSTKGGGRLISALVLNMLLFVSLGSFVDAAFEWFGDRMNVPDLTFKKVSSYVFWPLPYLMGAAAADCGPLAELIGVRILTSSSVTYLNLGKMFKNRQSFLEYSAIHNDTIFGPGRDVILPAWNTTLIDGFMEPRSEIVGSYAMCGFASLTSIGMALSTIGVIAPKRLGETSKVMIRAFIVSTIASFITACMAGLLFIEE